MTVTNIPLRPAALTLLVLASLASNPAAEVPEPQVGAASDTTAAAATLDATGPALPAPTPAPVVEDATGLAAELRALDLDDLDARTRSTILFGGSSPVSFSGEARVKFQDHYLLDFPTYMKEDRTRTGVGYEGNESILRLGMVVRPNRSTVLWSKIGFQHTMPGNFVNGTANVNGIPSPGPDGFERIQDRHDKMEVAANIHEDMSAGLAIRTIPASAWLRMGNVLWTEASPLTIWKAQPRTFAWEYLPYEIEQPVSRYYEYNVAKGEKTGRAAWNKKPFNGVDIKSLHMPLGINFALLYGTFERFDNFEREFMDFSGDLGYTGETTAIKGQGVGDSFRHLAHARISKDKLIGDLTLGYNGVGILYNPDIALSGLYAQTFGFPQVFGRTQAGGSFPYRPGEGFYKRTHVHSFDLRGAIGSKIEIHSDLALGFQDTLWTRLGVDSLRGLHLGTPQADDSITYHVPTRLQRTTSADPVPAFFTRLRYKAPISLQADIAVIPKGFYSPFSFSAPQEAFFPFGSNMVGGGKFVSRGEGSPYIQNMAGMNLTASTNPGYGHFRVTYGQHMQMEAARDVLFFPYRLNGQDLMSVFHTSYNRWGNGLIDHSLGAKYQKRLGDESFRTNEYLNPYGADAGGLRTDYLSAFEGFVPYESQAQADSSILRTTTIYTRNPFVPKHKKWTFNLEVDGAWEIGSLVGYSRELFLSGYVAINGVSKDFRALAFGPSDMMLWGGYARLEPAIAVSEKLYFLALAGYETWQSEMAYMDSPDQTILHKPIEYNDMALGVGFDWDFSARVGLHGRLKWMKHVDEEFTDNNWTNRLGSAEIKMWF